MNTKGTNDAAAFIRTIAEKRHRNVQWAEEAVRYSVAITEEEAIQDSVIDYIANDDRELLVQIDGKTDGSKRRNQNIANQKCNNSIRAKWDSSRKY